MNYVYNNFTLANSDDAIILYSDSSVLIDSVVYDNGYTFPDPSGASMALKDTSLDNDDGENWCTSTTTFGDGDFGTPGKANDCLCEGDLDNDGDIDGSDLAIFSINFGRTDCP